jgi:hypothetical protein
MSAYSPESDSVVAVIYSLRQKKKYNPVFKFYLRKNVIGQTAGAPNCTPNCISSP